MVLPGLQEWQYRMYTSDDTKLRMSMIKMLRQEAANHMITQYVQRSKKISKQVEVEIGDFVLVELNSYEKAKLSKNLGNEKLAPKWSTPWEVIGKPKNKQHLLKLKSVVDNSLIRDFPITKIQLIPKDLVSHLPDAVTLEVRAENRSHAASEGTEYKSAPQLISAAFNVPIHESKKLIQMSSIPRETEEPTIEQLFGLPKENPNEELGNSKKRKIYNVTLWVEPEEILKKGRADG